MDQPTEQTRSLGYLVTSLDSQVQDTTSSIDELTKFTKNLVSAEDYADLIKQHEKQSVAFDERELMAQLEKVRLQLVMAIQQQDFAATKLQEMIVESQELVQSVEEHYATKVDNEEAEESAAEERMENYVSEIAGSKVRQLDSNLADFDNKFDQLQINVASMLRDIEKGYEKISSQDYQESLNEVIVSLNASFKYFVNGDLDESES